MPTSRTAHQRLVVPWLLLLALTPIGGARVVAQPAAQVMGVRLDDAFRLVGSDSSGLVISVTLAAQQTHRTSDDFALVVFDKTGQRTGSKACLAAKFLGGSNPKVPWTLLDDGVGTLARGYRAMIDAHTAIVHKGRRIAIVTAGRYELVYLVSTTETQGALAYGSDVVHQPARLAEPLLTSFKIPWP